jgi:hypothetical protein
LIIPNGGAICLRGPGAHRGDVDDFEVLISLAGRLFGVDGVAAQ